MLHRPVSTDLYDMRIFTTWFIRISLKSFMCNEISLKIYILHKKKSIYLQSDELWSVHIILQKQWFHKQR